MNRRSGSPPQPSPLAPPRDDALSGSHITMVGNDLLGLAADRVAIIRALIAAGAQVTLVGPQNARPTDSTGASMRAWALDRHGVDPVAQLRSVARLRRLFNELRPDLIQTFTLKPAVYAPLANRGSATPIVTTITGLGWLFSDDPRARLLLTASKPLIRQSLRAEHVSVVCQNHGDVDSLTGRGFATRGRVRTILGSGVDVGRFHPAEARTLPRRRVALLGGRLLRQKGVEQFVLAAEILAKKRVPVEFWVAGIPDDSSPDSVTAEEIARWEKRGHVRFLGHVKDMAALLRDAHVAVLPTTYPEGIPRFLLEAAASGLPLIAVDTPACRTIVRSDENGLLLPTKDPALLADAIWRILSDDRTCMEMGRRSRSIAVEEFAQERVVGAYLSLYRELIRR